MTLRRGRRRAAVEAPSRVPSYDSWLVHFQADRLQGIEEALAEPTPDGYRLFRDLDDDLWTVLLFRQYSRFPNILRFLPDLPPPAAQRKWNHAAGMHLAPRSNAFYGKLKAVFANHGSKPLAEARVLDFGCGWGRMTRFFARDVAPGSLLGCDAFQESLSLCERLRVPAEVALSDPVPEALPFDGVDLVFAHSVFTHLSEAAHEACLRAIHKALAPGGLAVLTVRPPAYMFQRPMARVRKREKLELEEPRYYFQPGSSQGRVGGETNGNTFITYAYMQERWTELFEIVDVSFMLESMTQVVVTLRAKPQTA